MKGETDFKWERLPGGAGSKVREHRVKVRGGDKVTSLDRVTREVKSSGKIQVSGRLKKKVENKKQYHFCLSDQAIK